LTLRLWLAVFGLLVSAVLAIWLYLIDVPSGFVIVLVVLAATALIDIGVVVRRKRRGEPG
jgi:4-hydroxybenzoate polyprenyltransferase